IERIRITDKQMDYPDHPTLADIMDAGDPLNATNPVNPHPDYLELPTGL
ncbi:15331_t:CDS:1, partial [Gigaspora rosea]